MSKSIDKNSKDVKNFENDLKASSENFKNESPG